MMHFLMVSALLAVATIAMFNEHSLIAVLAALAVLLLLLREAQ
jgi:hypothetical protein